MWKVEMEWIQRKQEISKQEERVQWGNGLEFLMSCIAMSVGLGNIWRFPFIANRNGGGAFLIPYLIILTFIGRPMYYMEMALGQFSSRGSVKMYEKLAPVFKGIGYGQIIGTTSVASYYCILMAITLFYFINSFTFSSDFPWATCHDEWKPYTESRNITCIDKHTNVTSLMERETISSSELYFRKEVLKEMDDISESMGLPEWRLSLLLLLSWVLIFFVSIRGVKSSGKASYFLALFPYVIMITLLIRAATLEGAVDGMLYFIETDFSKLLEAEVWYAAVTQCFFSLNVGFGTIIMFSSYNKIDHNINRDALVVTTLDTFTSLLSGVTIFGILGNLAYEMNIPPNEVLSAGGGTGIAFISYPDAISKFSFVPWLFAILFFFMLFVLGIGSIVALHATLNTAIKDAFPTAKTWMISASTAICLFFTGLIYTTPGGQYTLDLVDHFGGTFVIFVCAILEVTAITWIYGLDNFCTDVEFMTKKKVGIYWRISWGIITPVLLLVIFVYFLVTLKPLTYGIYSLEYPLELSILGWGLLAVTVIQILMWIIYGIFTNRGYPVEGIIGKSFSTENWSPNGQEENEQWRKFKEDKIAKRGVERGSWLSQKVKDLTGS
uniref:Transporter n=1 Tax=Leptinotarsa decemlineata TaxID=7539 RepID=A0A0M4MP60_LEPDE|nr:nutrient amino acid trasporter 2 [Leptinotarsa decemlineata]